MTWRIHWLILLPLIEIFTIIKIYLPEIALTHKYLNQIKMPRILYHDLENNERGQILNLLTPEIVFKILTLRFLLQVTVLYHWRYHHHRQLTALYTPRSVVSAMTSARQRATASFDYSDQWETSSWGLHDIIIDLERQVSKIFSSRSHRLSRTIT